MDVDQHLIALTSHTQPSPEDKSSTNGGITATQFGIGLFQKNGPQFVAIGFHEMRRFGSLGTRNAIINRDDDPFFFEGMKDANLVQSPRIIFLGQKHVSNDIGEFTGTRKGGHQPTIAHGSLTQIVGFNITFKELGRFAMKGL